MNNSRRSCLASGGQVLLFAGLLLPSLAVRSTAAAAGLSLRRGDVIVNSLNRIIQYRPNGTEVFRFDGLGTEFQVFEGAAILPDRRIATTRRAPVSGLVIIAADGVTSFDTPQVAIPGDVSVFSDGTFAISDQGGDIDLYSPTGSYVTSIIHPGLSTGNPFGNVIDTNDTLWVAAFGNDVLRFSSSGEFLGSVPVGFTVRDLAVDYVDDTMWIPSPDGVIRQFDVNGAELFSFPTTADPPFVYSIAIGPDRTLYLSLGSSEVFHYDRAGELLDSFVHDGRRPTFMSVVFIPEPSMATLLTSLVLCAMSGKKRSG